MSSFFKRLNYSFGNEDWNTETKALNLNQQDRVVCVTASGDRPLNLLTSPCHSIVAVDLNPHQNNLLKLKAAAMHTLDFNDYLSFLGATDSVKRKKTLHSLFPSMTDDTIKYWKTHEKSVSKGILYQGAIEKWTKLLSFCIKAFRKEKQKRLFAFDDIELQKQFVQEHWASPRWRRAFEVVLHPLVTRFFLNDPGLNTFCDKSLHIGRYIYDRMNKSLEKGLARENLLISLILMGKVLPEGYPPYLKDEGTSVIRKALPKLSVVTANMIDYLESVPASSVDAFSLSDIASYMSANHFERLSHAIHHAAAPGAKFCIRQFLSGHKIPTVLQPSFKRNYVLEQELEQEDRCFVYRFLTGTISK